MVCGRRPDKPHTNQTRKQTAAALTEGGYPITAIALSGLAHQGEGPRYAIFGRRAVYCWGSSVAWAEARLGDPRARASELAALRAERKAASAAADDPRLIAAESYELERAARTEKRDATAEPVSEPVE